MHFVIKPQQGFGVGYMFEMVIDTIADKVTGILAQMSKSKDPPEVPHPVQCVFLCLKK